MARRSSVQAIRAMPWWAGWGGECLCGDSGHIARVFHKKFHTNAHTICLFVSLFDFFRIRLSHSGGGATPPQCGHKAHCSPPSPQLAITIKCGMLFVRRLLNSLPLSVQCMLCKIRPASPLQRSFRRAHRASFLCGSVHLPADFSGIFFCSFDGAQLGEGERGACLCKFLLGLTTPLPNLSLLSRQLA